MNQTQLENKVARLETKIDNLGNAIAALNRIVAAANLTPMPSRADLVASSIRSGHPVDASAGISLRRSDTTPVRIFKCPFDLRIASLRRRGRTTPMSLASILSDPGGPQPA